MLLDYLAYAVLAIFYILTVLPLVGASEDSYTRAMGLGFLIHIAVLVSCGVVASLFWASCRVLDKC